MKNHTSLLINKGDHQQHQVHWGVHQRQPWRVWEDHVTDQQGPVVSHYSMRGAHLPLPVSNLLYRSTIENILTRLISVLLGGSCSPDWNVRRGDGFLHSGHCIWTLHALSQKPYQWPLKPALWIFPPCWTLRKGFAAFSGRLAGLVGPLYHNVIRLLHFKLQYATITGTQYIGDIKSIHLHVKIIGFYIFTPV